MKPPALGAGRAMAGSSSSYWDCSQLALGAPSQHLGGKVHEQRPRVTEGTAPWARKRQEVSCVAS